MASDGDEGAKRVAYQSFNPGPRKGEAIAIDFLRMDGVKGLIFAATKIGALLMSNPKEVDEGWLWSQAVEICGEDKASAALSEAGSSDPRVEAYRRAVAASAQRGISNSKEITGLSYEDLRPRMPGLRGFRLSSWGKQASADDFERCGARTGDHNDVGRSNSAPAHFLTTSVSLRPGAHSKPFVFR